MGGVARAILYPQPSTHQSATPHSRIVRLRRVHRHFQICPCREQTRVFADVLPIPLVNLRPELPVPVYPIRNLAQTVTLLHR